MLFDCHIHSTISADGKCPINDMCRSAIEKGLSLICFTEHFDMNPRDINYGFYNHQKYCAEIEQAKRLFGDKIEILQGIEFSEPHLYAREFEKMTRNNFDFIIGSMHWLKDTWAGDKNIRTKYSIKEIYEIHYSETLKTVERGGFDSLAHLDFPKKYLDDSYEPAELIRRILSTLIKSNISLELNSSPLRKGKNFIFPGRTILNLYMKLGGSRVTIGSDAHNLNEIGSGNEVMLNQISTYNFVPVIYRNRKPYIITG